MKFQKIILRCIAGFLFFMAICSIYSYTLKVKDLASVTGKVSEIEIVFIQGIKYKHHPMIISLDNFTHKFRLMDVYKSYFDVVKKGISISDVIKIYYRTPFQNFFGLGKKYDIFQIEKNGNIIFSFSATKDQNIMSFFVFLFFCLFLFSLSFFIKENSL